MPGPDDVNLGGWHLAFATRYADVNEQIASQIDQLRIVDPSKYPTALNLSGGSGATAVALVGTLRPWRLASGGRDRSVTLAIMVDNPVASFGDPAETISGDAVRIQIDGLLQVAQPGNTIRVVKPNLAGGSPYTVNCDGFVDGLSSIQQVLLNALLAEFLDARWGIFGGELMTVDPQVKPPPGVDPAGWEWMSPQNCQALVSETGATEDDHEFIVVSMTGGIPPPQSVALQGRLIPPNATLGYAIAAGVFLENVVQPGLAQTFLKAAPERFKLTGRRLWCDEPISVDSLQVDDGHTVSATFTGVAFEVNDDTLDFTTHVAFPYQQDSIHAVDVDLDLTVRYAIGLERVSVKRADGSMDSDYPLVKTEVTYNGIENLRVEANELYTVLQWAVSLGATLVVTLGAVAAGAYKGRSDWETSQAGAGRTAVQMRPMGGQPNPATPATLATATQQATGAAAGEPLVMWGPLPRSSALSIMGIVGSGLLGGVMTMIPAWIILTHTRDAKALAGNLDEAISNLLSTFRLPNALSATSKVSSIGLNNALVIGATRVVG